MKKLEAIKILQQEGYTNIVEIKKEANYFLDDHSHRFSVDLIVLSGSFIITTSDATVTLFPGSRYKLKKNVIHTKKSGDGGVVFLSARPDK